MRKVMVVSLMGLRERKRKLFFNPFWRPARLGCTCRYESTFKATGLRAVFIFFPGKALRPVWTPGSHAYSGVEWSTNYPSINGRLSLEVVAYVAAPLQAEQPTVRSPS